jgi:hypothetical protein
MAVGFQRKRVAGWRKPDGGVFVDRSTPFGNPFPVMVFGRKRAVALFAEWLDAPDAESLGFHGREAAELNARRAVILARLHELRGRDLGCWCPLSIPCHRTVLLEKANADWRMTHGGCLS